MVQENLAARRWAEQLNSDLLLCRDLGHLWDSTSQLFNKKTRVYLQQLRCDRCTTIRNRVVAADGEILKRWYVYPRTYHSPKGVGRYTVDARAALRVESLERLIKAAGDAGQRARKATTG